MYRYFTTRYSTLSLYCVFLKMIIIITCHRCAGDYHSMHWAENRRRNTRSRKTFTSIVVFNPIQLQPKWTPPRNHAGCFETSIFHQCLRPPFTQKRLFIVTLVGCLSLIVQNGVCAEFENRKLFSHSSAEQGKFLCVYRGGPKEQDL